MAMLDFQKGVCAICKKTARNGKRLEVDHDHVTGKVRGLLCRNCNVAVGLVLNDLKIAEKMIEYIKNEGITLGDIKQMEQDNVIY